MALTMRCGRFELMLDRPLVMGVLNVTPDSFSDGGRYVGVDQALTHARQLIAEGVDILDIGGESTRPGAQEVDAQAEFSRLAPMLEALRDAGVPLSVDTCKADVMRQVLDAGADMINDIAGFRDPEAIRAVASSDCALCVMHMKGEPRTMQQAPFYEDVVAEVRGFLEERVAALRQAGVAAQRIVLDAGFGFGKNAKHNYTLLKRMPELFFDDYPWLVGVSRKTMIGHVTGRAPHERLAGSLAGALAGIAAGASIVRVHDVAQTRDAMAVWLAVQQGVSE